MSRARDGGEVRRLYQEVADQIRALIRSGQFPAQTRLPAERDLAQQLNVSRPSLREALIALEIDGTVEIRMGSGVYVLEPSDRGPALTRALGESPTELMQARVAVEGAVALLACARVSPSFLDRLGTIGTAMVEAIEAGQDPMAQDRAFHMAIAEQTGNSVLSRIVAFLFDERFSRISARLSSRYEDRRSWMAAAEEHAAVLRALTARDSLSAQAAMTRHLQLSAERWIDR